jgi:predicted ATP-dependent endonuclease of OLD family
MKIKFVEIQNFRKLKSCRVDFADNTTIFVGANNSGKTSAMDALVKFLIKNEFSTTDFTLSNWPEINKIGMEWEKEDPVTNTSAFSINVWEKFLPSMDVWLQIDSNEIHHVAHLIPTLDWEGGLLGVRLRLEPVKSENFYKEYRASSKSAKETTAAAKSKKGGETISLELWPRSMQEFLEKRLSTHFSVRAYTLDPSKCQLPDRGIARPQEISADSELMNASPFKGLILIDNINAQRGFSDPGVDIDPTEETHRAIGSLSSQLRAYYDRHLNPEESPDSTDIDALQAIENAQDSFDKKLKEGFNDALRELEGLGYPGFSDPRITISSKIRPMDSLNHKSSVQYELMSEDSKTKHPLRLPEQYNGLGYQNLISMVFRLMRFRDKWMQVGKVGKKTTTKGTDLYIEPLHLVLVEEPEAHLHVQVQQVFIRKAHEILCNHENLKTQSCFVTQLVVSTHSGHIAHEMNFACLRYFRRKPASSDNEVPTSTVVNLSEVFGKGDETEKFVTRYLESTHCDLFFADAAILVEGPAERMLVPHFIRHHFKKLNESYISLLEIGGSHAHRLRPLIEHLGLTSLIITDLDSADPKDNNKAVQPRRGQEFVTSNNTLKEWIPCKDKIDELLDLKNIDKVMISDDSFSVRVAYQCPARVKLKDTDAEEEALPYTIEDALVFDNLDVFRKLKGNGLIKKFNIAINEKQTISELGKEFFDSLRARSAKKAEFALELLFLQDPKELKVPTYIDEGLSWLQEQLEGKQKDFFVKSTMPTDMAQEKDAKC